MSPQDKDLLTDYLAGFLTQSQVIEIEQKLVNDPELRAELNAIEHSLEKYAHGTSQEINDDLRSKIWQKLEQSVPLSEEKPYPIQSNIIFDENASTKRLGGILESYIGIAAAVLLIASILGNLYLANQVAFQKNNFLTTLDEKNALQTKIREIEAANELVAAEVSMLKNPAMRVCKLMSDNPQEPPRSLLLAIDMEKDKQVMVISPELPSKPEGHSYQLWAVSATGETVCLGTFDAEKKIYTMKKLPFVPKEFGVTVEVGELGQPQPTSDFLVRGI